MGVVVGIDASRNRSGGAKVHLMGILNAGDPLNFGISKVHVWSYRSLLDVLPNSPWLIKHNPPELEKSLPRQLWWQYHSLPISAKKNECMILLNTDAGTVCRFRPAVTMHRDMLPYDETATRQFGISLARLRIITLKSVKSSSMNRSDGVIFLTNYASYSVQKMIGKLNNFKVIHHGIENAFKQSPTHTPSTNLDEAIQCLYVSNTLPYKHQWHVVRAIHILRNKGLDLRLILAGGGNGRSQRWLDQEILRSDPDGKFVNQLGFVAHGELPNLLSQAHLFIFASSCEAMPNTLVEAMASGLPIACSNRGPMPEILQDGGVYFDPESPTSIALAIEKIITNPDLRISIAKRAKALSEKYSWEKCANETWGYLSSIASQSKTGSS